MYKELDTGKLIFCNAFLSNEMELRKTIRPRKRDIVIVLSLIAIIKVYQEYNMLPDVKEMKRVPLYATVGIENCTNHPASTRRYLITYYNTPKFIKEFRKYAMIYDFTKCEWNNCEITYDSKNAYKSDVVIFNGIFKPTPTKLNFDRPLGQVWIFAEIEPPSRYRLDDKLRYNSKYLFNWTMVYNQDNTDIHLPYGEIIKRSEGIKRDYEQIAREKANMSLIVASHCYTHSKRKEYVDQLKKYMNVTILGKCGGQEWTCGKRYAHNDTCFEILDSYKFFLAFENSFCQHYFTEKMYDNYNYNTIIVTRGGLPGDANRIFPKGTFISSDDFKSAKDLAFYLKHMTVIDYASMLRKKDQFLSVGFENVFQRALCKICQRMNFQEKFRKNIQNMNKWVNKEKYCTERSDVRDIT